MGSEISSDSTKTYEKELATLTKGTGITFLGKIIGGSVQYIYSITFARLLGADGLGLFMLGLTVINFASMFSRLGLDSGVIRYVSLYRGTGDNSRVKGAILVSLKYVFLVSILMGILLFLTSEFIGTRIFQKNGFGELIRLLSVSLPFLSLTIIALSSTVGFQSTKYVMYGTNLFQPITNLFLFMLFFILGLQIKAGAVAFIISYAGTSLLAVYFIFRLLRDIKKIPAILETRELLKFSLPLLIVVFSNFLLLWSDTLMLGYFRLSEDVGIYNAAMRTALLASLILASFNYIFPPIISNLYHQQQMRKLETLFKITTKWIFTASLPIFLVTALLSSEIMKLFGSNFTAGSETLIILAFGQLVNASVGSVGFILIMSGRQQLMMWNTVCVCLLNIIFNFFLIPIHGIIGASIASAVAFSIFNLGMLIEVYILMGMHPYSRKFIKPLVFGMISYCVTFLVRPNLPYLDMLGMLSILILLFCLIYGSLIFIWGIDHEDAFIIDLFKNKLLRIFS